MWAFVITISPGAGWDVAHLRGDRNPDTAIAYTNNYTYKYENSNNNHLVTKITNDNVSMNITYDNYGNSTATTLSSDSNSSAGKIVTSAKYSDDGTQMTSQTDANGSTTTYTYNTQRTVSSQEDAKGTTNYHSYFAESGRPKTNYITDVISAGYEYSCGNLVTVRRSGFITLGGTKQTQYYNMGYDSFGNMTSISVGSRELASYDYGSQNGNLRSMTYGNGATVSYTYDSLDRVTEEKWGDTLKYQYFYNAEGDLAKKLDVTTGKAVNYEYDSLGRLIHSYQTDNDVVQQRTEHLYDTENRLTSQSWQLGSTLYKESFTYSDKDGSLTEVGLEGAAGYRFTYDALKRLSYLTNGIYKKSYTYTNVADGQTSTQVARVRYAADNSSSVSAFSLNYTYDEVGNISAITTGFLHGAASYSYDQQGQLIQETNYYGTNTYTYDTYGNIRSETRKLNSGTTTTYEYGYEDTNGWLDLLTSYRGHSISYDAIGNPTNWYNGTSWTFTWQNGRQLARAASSGATAGYTYDVAGIRDSKTVTTTSGTITYNYLTQNGQVVRQTWTDLDHVSHVMDFIYDNNGKPYAFYYDGTLYYYITNLQGDVIRIIDTAGATICTYTYDAWGRLLNSSTNQIFKANPIRYRGYYYDTESGLYYLGSRYYDPQVKRFINADGAAFATINPYSNGLTDKNYFAYCDNDPVSRKDDVGTFFNTIIGGIVGGITAACSAALSGESGRNIAAAAAGGAVSGAISGLGIDATIATAGIGSVALVGAAGAAGSVAGGLVESRIRGEKYEFNGATAKKAVASAVVNLVSFGYGKGTDMAFNIKSPKVSGIKKIFKALVKSTKNLKYKSYTFASTGITIMQTVIGRMTNRIAAAKWRTR